jgi:hypothetical protein
MTRAAILLSLLLCSTAFAVPTELSHQGRLMDNTGIPYSGSHYLTFRLYESTTAQTPLWEDTIVADFDNGYYAVQLGTTATNLLDDAIFESDALYLGLAIDGGAELPDRIPVSSTPFARRAGLAGGVDGGIVNASEVQVNGLTVIDGTGTFIGALSDQTLSGLGCSSGELPQFSSSSGWMCVDGGIVALSCTADQVPSYDGSDWACADTSDPFGALNCAADDILVYDGSAWDCSGAAGGSLWSDTAAPEVLLDLVALGCTDGQTLSWDATASAWTCGDFQDTTLSQGTVISYVTDSSIDLAAGSTVGGSSISTTDTLNDLGCADNEIVQYASGAWQCAPITITGGDTLDSLPCAENSVAEYSGGTWSCATIESIDSDTVGDLSCTAGHVVEFDGTSWGCTPSASLNTDTLATLSCETDDIIAYNKTASTWECTPLALSDSDTLADLLCDDGEIAAWSDTAQAWECTVLALSDADTLADLALSCASGDIPQWQGAYWTCSSASLANLSCSTDEIPLWDGSAWSCVAAATATVSWNDITSMPSSLADIATDGLDENALPFTGLDEVSGNALDNEFTYSYPQDTPVTINDGQENNPTSSTATVSAIGPVLSFAVTVNTLGNSNHGALQYILRHEYSGQIIDYTIVSYGDYSGSSSAAETWTVTDTLHNMVSTQTSPVYATGTWTLLAYDNADLPANPNPGEDGSFTWSMELVAVTPDQVSVNGDLIVDGDLMVAGTISQLGAPTFSEATLTNGWVNYDNGYAPAGYMRDASGFIHLRGLIKDGAFCPSTNDPDCVLFVLPNGYRPEYRAIFAQENHGNGSDRVDVKSNGEVVITSPSVSDGWLSLEGIVFAVAP